MASDESFFLKMIRAPEAVQVVPASGSVEGKGLSVEERLAIAAQGGITATDIQVAKELGSLNNIASQVLISTGDLAGVRDVITAALKVEPTQRIKVLQALIGLAGKVPAGNVTKMVTHIPMEALTAANKTQIAGVVKAITRYGMPSQLLSLPQGASGAIVSIDEIFTSNGPMVSYTYSLGDKVLAEFSYPIDGLASAEIPGWKTFFARLKEDGHEIIDCIGTPMEDFSIGVFGALNAVKYDGKSGKMTFTVRPESDRIVTYLRGVRSALYSHNKSIFAQLNSRLLRHYQSLPSFAPAPADHMAWLWENRPKDPSVYAGIAEVVQFLQREYDRNILPELKIFEASIVEAANILPDSLKNSTHFPPIAFAQSIELFEQHRMLRGRDAKGPSASIHNGDFKVVGTDPLGTVGATYQGEIRYLGIIDHAVERGYKKMLVYTHLRKLPIVEYARKKGIEVEIFSSEKNAGFLMADLSTASPVATDGETLVVLDIIVHSKAQGGVYTDISEWIALNARLLQLVDAKRNPEVVLFSRPPCRYENEKILFDAGKMALYTKTYTSFNINFDGVRHHNGEFLLWLSSRAPTTKPISGQMYLPTAPTVVQQIMVVFESLISRRLQVANVSRTFAVIMGRWGFVPQDIITPLGRTDISARYHHRLKVRQEPYIRAERGETHTTSTAETFGREEAPFKFEALAELGVFGDQGKDRVAHVSGKDPETFTVKEPGLEPIAKEALPVRVISDVEYQAEKGRTFFVPKQ